MAGFHVEFSGFSLLMAVCLNVIGITNLLLGMLVMSMGEVSIYTLFMMLGGMVLPFSSALFSGRNKSPRRELSGLFCSSAPYFCRCSAVRKKKGNGQEAFSSVRAGVLPQRRHQHPLKATPGYARRGADQQLPRA